METDSGKAHGRRAPWAPFSRVSENQKESLLEDPAERAEQKLRGAALGKAPGDSALEAGERLNAAPAKTAKAGEEQDEIIGTKTEARAYGEQGRNGKA